MKLPKWIWLVPLLIVLVAGAPFASLLISEWAIGALGCKGHSDPCLFAGRDIRTVLNNMFLFGWLSAVTIPFGLIGLLGWLVAAIQYGRLRHKHRRSA